MTIESIDRFEPGARYHDPLRDELVELLRASAAVDGPAGPRPHVWANIEAAISSDARPARSSAALLPPTSLVAVRRRRTRGTFTRVAAIAAAVSFVGGVALAALGPLSSPDPGSQASAPVAGPDATSVERAARRAADLAGAQVVQLTSADGTYSVDVVVLPDGTAYVLGSRLPDGDAPYLLYAVVGETRVLLGTLRDDGAMRLDRIPLDRIGAGPLLLALVDGTGAIVAGASLPDGATPATDASASADQAPSGASPAVEDAPPAPSSPRPLDGSADAPATAPSEPPPPPAPPPGIDIDLPLLPPINLSLLG